MIVEKEDIKDKVLKALADNYSKLIILSTIDRAKSVLELCKEHNIPIATAYRKVKELQDLGLLVVERIALTEDGKKFDLYRSAIKVVRITFESKDVKVEIIPNEDLAGKLSRLWLQIKGR